MASLTLKGITKEFGKNTALSCVDLCVEDGEFCVLLGPSGCGKSTLLSIIAGLIRQDEGTVMFDARPVDGLSPRERNVAMVFQNYALYPHMTVEQNLSFGLRMRRLDKDTIDRRVKETARLLGIEDLLDRKPKELSGGQQQRVAMGRALVRRPRLFLLDEPLSNLDTRLRADVRLELKRVHGQVKGTIVYVTHDQVEAMTLGDKVVVMRHGKIHQVGPPDVIYTQPSDKFVATFIGLPEINLYKGQLVEKQRRLHFEGPGFTVDLKGLERPAETWEVELAVRPEDVEIDKYRGITPPAVVEMISDVGSEKYIHARLGKEYITLRAPKESSLKRGMVVPLAIDPKRMHFFQYGRRIQLERSCHDWPSS